MFASNKRKIQYNTYGVLGDVCETGGWSPQKNYEVGDGPCIRSPNISRSSVIGCVSKHELIKKGVMEEFLLFWNRGFYQEKGVIYVVYRISDSRDRQKTDKIQKSHQKLLALKWKCFYKKGHSKRPSPKLGAKSPPMCVPHASHPFFGEFSCVDEGQLAMSGMTLQRDPVQTGRLSWNSLNFSKGCKCRTW